MILSILIPSTNDRAAMTEALVIKLNQQAKGLPVQILVAMDNYERTTGAKRNGLLQAASGEYVCFFDSDDQPSDDYVTSLVRALQHRPDCVGFKGWLTYRRRKEEWIISNALPYVDATIAGKRVYLRHTNHLAPVRRDIALQVGFPDKVREEDHAYAMGLRGLLHTEVFVNKHLYTYQK